jgi:O-antigen ligase
MDKKIKLIDAVKLINLFSILLLVISLSVSFSKFQRVAFMLGLITYVIEIIYEKKWRTLIWENSIRQWFFLSIIIYFLLQFIYFPFENNIDSFKAIFEERVSFLAFGIIGFFGFNKYFKLKYFAWTFIATSFVLGVFLISKLNTEILFSDNRNDLLGLIRIKYISSHMKFNYFLNISLIFIYYLLAVYKIKKNFWTISALSVSFIVIIVNLFLSDGRIGLLSSLIIFSFIILRYLWSKSIGFTVVASIVFVLFVSISVQQNPRITLSKIKEDPRKEIWKVAAHEIIDANFVGVGASTASNNLKSEFSKRGMENFKHAHNIFLQTMVEYGFVGFLTILTVFILSFFAVSKRFMFIILLFETTTALQLLVGSFQMDLNPLVFLITISLIIQQDIFDKRPTNSNLLLTD